MPRTPRTLTALVRRKGGVKDFGGELADMLGGKTVRKVRKKTGTVYYSKSGRGIIRKRGMDLDDMRHVAIEEGFLPSDASFNDLLDALSDEARGRERRSVQEDYEAAARVWKKPRKRKKERPTIPAHPGNKKCKRCGRLHGKNAHRFHGPGSYVRTHKYSKFFGENPMATSTRTEVRSPTRTSTRAFTRGNTTLTITGNGNQVRVPGGLKNPRAFYVAVWGTGRHEQRAFMHKLAAQRFLKRFKLAGRVERWLSPSSGPEKNPRKARTKAAIKKKFTRMYADWKKTGFRKKKPLGNPRGRVVIYHKLLRIEAKKGPGHRCDAACRRADHSYFHDFKGGAVIYGQPDGSLTIRSNQGKRLWKFF